MSFGQAKTEGFNSPVIVNFAAGNFRINSAGIFVYNGTPAAGNLIFSIAQVTGVDQYGNQYLNGATAYDPEANAVHAVQLVNAGMVQWVSTVGMTSTSPIWWQETPAFNSVFQSIMGIQNIIDGSQPGLHLAVTTNNAIWLDSPTVVRGFGYVPAILTEVTTHTNANAGTENLSGLWTIPANDMAVGTVYEIEVPFNGTFENQTLAWNINLDGAGRALTSIGAGFFAVATTFQGVIRGKMQCISTGSTGQCLFWTEGWVGANGVRSSGVNNNNAALGALSGIVTVDTTVSHTFQLIDTWGGSTAGQTLTGFGSTFRRIGL